VAEWAPKGRGILGVRAMRIVAERGSLVAACVCAEGDEIFAIASNGVVIRTRVAEIRSTSRDTMGVAFMDLADHDSVVAVARASDVMGPEDLLDDDEVNTPPATAVSDDTAATDDPGEGVEQ